MNGARHGQLCTALRGKPAAPAAAKASSSTPARDGSNFRARRLSLNDLDTTEFDGKLNASPEATGRVRQRRLSMSPEMGVKPTAPPFPFEIVGTYSCHGVEPGIRQGETSAKINQDRGCICYPFGPTADGEMTQALFCVFDGHGACGDKVSHYAMNNVQEKLEKHPELISNPNNALKEVFLAVDAQLHKDPSIDAELSGTTAVVCLMRWTKGGKGTAWVANAGDSRAVLGVREAGRLKAVPLSEDQKPDTPAEYKRITKRGGFVSPPEYEWGGPARVWLDSNMSLPGLAMGRSIGDHLVGAIGVIAEPEVVEMDISPASDPTKDGPQFLVIASDGVWEFIDSPEAVDILHAANVSRSATEAVTKLIEAAAHKWRQEEGDYRDDITAVCVNLTELFKRG